MRVRKFFAVAFAALLLFATYIVFAPHPLAQYEYKQSDKVLHFVTFFLLTLVFYWTIDNSRRRSLHVTLICCTGALSFGFEILQALIPSNGRDFDYFDIVANVIGSLCALGLCAWYHKRMLDRKRRAKRYQQVPGEDLDTDVELGEGVEPQETGVTGEAGPSIDAELDNWDENVADDWDEHEEEQAAAANGDTKGTHATAGETEGKSSDTK